MRFQQNIENLPVTFIDMNFKIDVSVSSVPDQLFTIHVILHKATIFNFPKYNEPYFVVRSMFGSSVSRSGARSLQEF